MGSFYETETQIWASFNRLGWCRGHAFILLFITIMKVKCLISSYTGCPIDTETPSTLIFSFCINATGKVKPVLKNLYPNLLGATLILIFFKKLDYFLGSAKNKQKEIFFGAMPPSDFRP